MTSTALAVDSNGTPAGVSTYTPGTAPAGYRWFIQPYRMELQSEARSVRYRTDNGPGTNQGSPEVRGLVVPGLGPVLVTAGRVSVVGAPRTHYIITLVGKETPSKLFYTGIGFSDEYPNAAIFTLGKANGEFNALLKAQKLVPFCFLEIVRDYGQSTEETIREQFTA